jgi:hypothetical protein
MTPVFIVGVYADPVTLTPATNYVLNTAMNMRAIIELVEGVIRLGGMRVLQNPSHRQFEALLAKLHPDNDSRTMRGILDGDDLYLWDAIYADHHNVAIDLGIISNDWFEITGGTIIVNWGSGQRKVLKDLRQRL